MVDFGGLDSSPELGPVKEKEQGSSAGAEVFELSLDNTISGNLGQEIFQ